MGVELRKMFDTRSGFWLMASVVILAVIATGAVILFAPAEDQTYDSFAAAIGIPMTIVLPIIAALSVTSEWSQRTGLTTFTMVPSRSRVVLAKLVDTVLIGITSILVALAVGVVGNVVGSQLAGVPTTWDMRSPTSSTSWAATPRPADGLHPRHAVPQLRCRDRRLLRLRDGAPHPVGRCWPRRRAGTPTRSAGWTSSSTRACLYDGDFSATDWAQLAVTGTVWLLLPLAFGLWRVLRSEVK